MSRAKANWLRAFNKVRMQLQEVSEGAVVPCRPHLHPAGSRPQPAWLRPVPPLHSLPGSAQCPPSTAYLTPPSALPTACLAPPSALPTACLAPPSAPPQTAWLRPVPRPQPT
jgi:hypothetical protein